MESSLNLQELELLQQNDRERHWPTRIPPTHTASLDTRVLWLWNQRWGVVESVYHRSPDALDRFVAQLYIQAVLMKDLDTIRLLFVRLEGGAVDDVTIHELASSLNTGF